MPGVKAGTDSYITIPLPRLKEHRGRGGRDSESQTEKDTEKAHQLWLPSRLRKVKPVSAAAKGVGLREGMMTPTQLKEGVTAGL